MSEKRGLLSALFGKKGGCCDMQIVEDEAQDEGCGGKPEETCCTGETKTEPRDANGTGCCCKGGA